MSDRDVSGRRDTLLDDMIEFAAPALREYPEGLVRELFSDHGQPYQGLFECYREMALRPDGAADRAAIARLATEGVQRAKALAKARKADATGINWTTGERIAFPPETIDETRWWLGGGTIELPNGGLKLRDARFVYGGDAAEARVGEANAKLDVVAAISPKPEPPPKASKKRIPAAPYEDVKAAIEQHGQDIEAELRKAAEAACPGRRVKRDDVRDSIEELWGRPGRVGRPRISRWDKSPQK